VKARELEGGDYVPSVPPAMYANLGGGALHDTKAESEARLVSRLAVDVLLQGETGAGKDVLAKDIHRWSGRPGKFIAVNCAAIPEAIAESELFGYEAGAFTGAVRAREGKLEAADKGTLYLDEIDSMPMASQAKLLRALQERGTERLGGNRFYKTEFRVIASTKAPLPALITEGKFRLDLYFRLNVVKISLPPLRLSRDRIYRLFEHFLSDAATRNAIEPPPIGDFVKQALVLHHWPGNIRELRNAAERFCLGFSLLDDDLNIGSVERIVSDDAGTGSSLRDRLRDFESEVIMSSLKRHRGSVAKVSIDLQVPQNTLYYRIKTLGIRMQDE
jgi:transcriptional regulator with PAS, ATPase and Fis domain